VITLTIYHMTLQYSLWWFWWC